MAHDPGLEKLAKALRKVSSAAVSSAAVSSTAASSPAAPWGESRSPESGVFGRPSRAVPCGWRTADGALSAAGEAPGLVRGGVHEWFGVGESSVNGRAGSDWAPPLFVLAHVARRAVLDATERGAPATVVWIGRRVWPYPRALTGGAEVIEVEDAGVSDVGEFEIALALRETPETFAAEGGDLFGRSLFVDPPDVGQRLWAIDTALRCGGVTAVVADGSSLGMAATRRLQLAAAAAEALVLTARPPAEVREVSAATTRWTVTRAPAGAAPEGPRWLATLLRAKGAQHLHRENVRRGAMRHERRRGVG